MATAKKPEEKAGEVIGKLKLRVKELEDEVTKLKHRLDELRKAKNTTITKREREVLEVGFPRRDPKFEARIAEMEKQMKDLETQKNKEIEELKRKHAAEIADLTKTGSGDMAELRRKLAAEMKEMENRLSKEKRLDNSDDLAALRKKLADAEDDKAAILIENADVKDRIASLLSELSIKEAKWCETEEDLNMKLKRAWGDKYGEWMQETETKIQELQEANAILRQYLHRTGNPPPGDVGRSGGDS